MARTSEDVQQHPEGGIFSAMEDREIQRIWDRFILGVAGTYETLPRDYEGHQPPEGHSFASEDSRIRYEFYPCSDSAEVTIPTLTMRFKKGINAEQIERFKAAIITRMNQKYGVTDFRMLSGTELDAFIYGCHKHNNEVLEGEPNTSGSLTH